MKWKTVVHNRTNILFKLKEGCAGVYRTLHILRPGHDYILMYDPTATWREYSLEGERGIGTVIISSDDLDVWKSIDLVQRGQNATEFEWKGITTRTSPVFWTEWKNASRKVEAIASFSVELEKDLKRVVIYRAQCAHLVQFCSERLQKIREIFSLHSMWRLYWRGDLQILANSLDNLVRALMSAQMLLKGCGKKEWRRAALVLSLPPPDPQNLEKYSGSKFAHVIRELGWSFDLIQYALVEDGTGGFGFIWDDGRDRGFQFIWDDGRDRYVLQGEQPEDGVAGDERELLEGDRVREILDHKELLSDLENGSIVRDNSSIALGGWSKGSHQDFVETIKNRCQKQTIQNWCQKEDFDIDHLHLQKKKFIGRGGFKEVHKGKWLGLEVAIATFELQGNTSQGIECEDVEKEARFMVTLHHPNVVDFYGCATQKNQSVAFLVMEFMEEDLGSVIGRIMKYRRRRFGGLFPLYRARQLHLEDPFSLDFGGPFSLSVTVDILMQIVEAMIHSHKHQVMHRDLKPANCLVSKKAAPRFDGATHYTVKVIDFGISKSWSTETDINTARQGTDHYRAPEVWAGPDQRTCTYTWSADVYSFAMLCFEVITGSKPLTSAPFNRCNTAKAKYELLSQAVRPNIPPNCPGRLETLMRKCWVATPTDRPTFKAIRRELWDLKKYIATY